MIQPSKRKTGLDVPENILENDNQVELSQLISAVHRALNEGLLVELEKLPNGTIKARTVTKKSITIPTA